MTNGSFPQYFREIIVPSGKPCHSCNRVSRPRMCSNSFCAEFISVNRFILEVIYLFVCLEHPGTWSIVTGLPEYAANELFLGAFIRDIIPQVYQWLFTRSLWGNYKLKFISAGPVPLSCSPVLPPLSVTKKGLKRRRIDNISWIYRPQYRVRSETAQKAPMMAGDDEQHSMEGSGSIWGRGGTKNST